MKPNLAVVAKPKHSRETGEQHELELYRHVFNSSYDAIAVMDPEGHYLQQNRAHQELIGYSDAELRGKTPAVHMGEENFARVAGALQHTGRFQGELEVQTKAGEKIIVELSAFSMTDTANRPVCYVGVKRNVTERYKVHKELKTRVQQQAVVAKLGQLALAGTELPALMEEAARAVAATLDADYCKVLELLPDGHRFLLRAGVGWRQGQVGRATVPANYDSQAGYALRCSEPVIVEDLRTETRFRDPEMLRGHDVVSGMSVLIPGANGVPFGVLGTHTRELRSFTCHDINFLQAVANTLATAIQRKCAEEALRESEQRFRLAQLAANISGYMWDLETGELSWLEQLSPVANLMPDHKFATWAEHIHPEDRPRVLAEMERAITSGCEFDVQFRLLAPNGNTLWLVSRGQAYAEKGAPRHVVGIVLDVTARRNAEELLQRSEKLAMLGRLAASIAHEINNPLESVTNLLYLLEQHPSLDTQARSWAHLAQMELQRVSHVSRQTLGFYRESATPIPVNLPELVDDVLKLYERKIDRKRVNIVRQYRLARTVTVYPAEIRQVFSNLLLNAIEAVEPGGTIVVRASEGRDWSRPEVGGVRLTVADNGHGIPVEYRKQIFKAFFTTKGEKGTGLGLWVTSGIVQKHGGSLRLCSTTREHQRGTSFSVFLPDPS